MTKNAWQEYFDGSAFSYMTEEYAQPWEQEVNFYLEVLGLPQQSRLLDVGCGTGRHTIELARQGYVVTGLDFSQGMLAKAEKAAKQSGVTVDWIHADATQFQVNEPYDAALCMLEAALGFLALDQDAEKHDQAILGNVNAALKPGGRLILGMSNAY